VRNSSEPDPPDEKEYLQRIIDARHLLSGEWVWDVLVALHRNAAQYTELLVSIQETSVDDGWPGRNHHHLRDATLTRTLRRLEQGELVERVRETEFPYRTTYQLSPPARELISAAVPVVLWVERHQDVVLRARQRRHAEDSAGG
jgi:DNA-binding HxlR family transcriptional regulator